MEHEPISHQSEQKDNQEVQAFGVEKFLKTSDIKYFFSLQSIFDNASIDQDQKDDVENQINAEALRILGMSVSELKAFYYPDQYKVKLLDEYSIRHSKSRYYQSRINDLKSNGTEYYVLSLNGQLINDQDEENLTSGSIENGRDMQVLPDRRILIAADNQIRQVELEDFESKPLFEEKDTAFSKVRMNAEGDIYTLTRAGVLNFLQQNDNEKYTKQEINGSERTSNPPLGIEIIPDGVVIYTNKKILVKRKNENSFVDESYQNLVGLTVSLKPLANGDIAFITYDSINIIENKSSSGWQVKENFQTNIGKLEGFQVINGDEFIVWSKHTIMDFKKTDKPPFVTDKDYYNYSNGRIFKTIQVVNESQTRIDQVVVLKNGEILMSTINKTKDFNFYILGEDED